MCLRWWLQELFEDRRLCWTYATDFADRHNVLLDDKLLLITYSFDNLDDSHAIRQTCDVPRLVPSHPRIRL